MVVTVVDVNYLTHESIRGFADILRRHLVGRSFNVYRGEMLNETPNLIDTYEGANLINISVEMLENGPMQVQVFTDKVNITFDTYDPNEFSVAIGADEGFSWTTFSLHQDQRQQTFQTNTYRRQQGVIVCEYMLFTVLKSHVYE